ncbi:unnamed protein product [Rhizophagus irregularis]|nr:unnamed protein product [Rhizophagus irregularis]
MQLKLNSYHDKIFEWIPYNQFIDIKEKNKGSFATLHSAKWKDGSLKYYDNDDIDPSKTNELKRKSYEKISENLEFSKYLKSKTYSPFRPIYGISQDPNTKNYIIVFKYSKFESYKIRCEKCSKSYACHSDATFEWCIPCQRNYFEYNLTNWSSKNEKIDDFIQEMQLKITTYSEIIFEWIPYDQFNDINLLSNGDLATAIWKHGSLRYDRSNKKLIRKPGEKVALIYIYSSQNAVNKFLDEVSEYLETYSTSGLKIYGISKNPDTNDYIMVLNIYEWCIPCQTDLLKKNFTKWTSGDKIIDDFIQEKQLSICDLCDKVVEWISCNQFNDIKEIEASVYSAIWKEGPMYYDHNKKERMRKPDTKVLLKKYLYNLQDITEFLNEVNKNYSVKFYGISLNPDTKDYIMVLQYERCEKCGGKYIDSSCLNGDSGYDTIYLAIWEDGPLYYEIEWIRESDKKVELKYLYNCQDLTEFFNKIKENYSIEFLTGIPKIYGISQDPYTKDYVMVLKYIEYITGYDRRCNKCGEQLKNRGYLKDKLCRQCQTNYLKANFANWTSNNEKIDNFIHEMQLKYIKLNDGIFYRTVFEWIPYNQFNNIKEVNKSDFKTLYSAIWKDGPRSYYSWKKSPERKVALKCFYNSQNIDITLKEGEEHLSRLQPQILFGISQIPDTKHYILANFVKWTSGIEKVDKFIQEKQLIINSYKDTIFEWIPYDQFNSIREVENGNLYLAIWTLKYDYLEKKELIREPNKKVAVKLLQHNSQNITNEIINYCSKIYIYGISQKPDTKDYIIVFQYEKCEKCNEKFVNHLDAEYELCKPCQINNLKENFINWTIKFNDIKEIKKDEFTAVYSAKWKDGPLKYDFFNKKEWTRESDKEVALKDAQNITELFSKIEEYLTVNIEIYGLSQNPSTKEYIMVLQLIGGEQCKKCGEQYINATYVWCKPCQMNYLKTKFKNKTSGSKVIDDFIQEIQLKFDYYRFLFEWIPYNQLSDIKMSKGDVATAIWKDGPFYYNFFAEKELMRVSNKKVCLKKYILQDVADFLNEVNEYLIKSTRNILKVHGISQNPNTNDYIMVLKYVEGEQCEKCGEQYTNAAYKWCNQCQTNLLKANFTNWTSDDEKIDNFIKEMQLKFDYDSYLFEWIPYDQFYSINEVEKNDFVTIYSAVWKDGPLYYDLSKKENLRESDKKAALNCTYNSQNTAELLNENMVIDGVFEWIPYNQFNNVKEIKEISKSDLSITYSAIWKDGPLRYDFFKRMEWTRESNKKVTLKYIKNSQDSAVFMNKVKAYLFSKYDEILKVHGISQNPVTEDYAMVLQYTNEHKERCEKCGEQYIDSTCAYCKWCKPCQMDLLKTNFINSSGNEKIDNFIEEMRLNTNYYNDIIFEWIPYDQFSDIEEVGKGGFSTVYFATWKDGPLKFIFEKKEWTRKYSQSVALKHLHNSQNAIDKLLIEV